MRIYVSGKISGLPYEDVKTRFDDCQALLESIGFEVVNPITMGLHQEATWEQHMVKDIELLLSCDSIYMMDNWTQSTGAGIEYDIAFRLGKDIWFESAFARDNRNVMRIQNAIHEVMGMKFSDYIGKSRKRDGFYARMIFVHHCRAMKMKLTKIAQYVHRDHSSMLHLLNKFDDEVKFNPYFRGLAEKVQDILNKNNNAQI